LTHRASPAQELDPAAAARELEAVNNRGVVTEHDYADHEKAVARARGTLRVASHKR
jgi:hypothetical protein